MSLLEIGQLRLLLFTGLAVALMAIALFIIRGNRRVGGRTIRVVGVGGGGANAVDAMTRSGMKGVEFVAVNTDLRALNRSSAGTKLAIGRSTTNGLGAGGEVRVGESAAREAAEAIGRALAGSDLVVIVAGLGGGTGSGAAPVIAEIARQQGALTVAVVTKPFGFEGPRRARVAQDAAAALMGLVDAVAAIPNDQVREFMRAEVTVDEAFRSIDQAVHRSVAEIVDLVAVPGRINLDFADVRAVLRGGGAAAVGFGRARGENRAIEATQKAMAATLLEGRIRGASSVLVNVSGCRKLRLAELDAVAETILAATGRDAKVMFGVTLNPRLRDDVGVTLIISPSGDGRAVKARSKRSPGFATEPLEAASPQAESVGSASRMASEQDRSSWRPVWLRRSTPASTPAPEASSSRRSPAGTSPRHRRPRRGSPEEERARSAGR